MRAAMEPAAIVARLITPHENKPREAQTKPEIRSPKSKEIRNPKSERRTPKDSEARNSNSHHTFSTHSALWFFGFRISGFGFPIPFELRISDFKLNHPPHPLY